MVRGRSGATFYRAVRPLVTVDAFFFSFFPSLSFSLERPHLSAYFHVFNAVTRNFCLPSAAPWAPTEPFSFSARYRCAPPFSIPSSCENELQPRAFRERGTEGARSRERRRETGGTRPAAIPRYTNLLAKLAKLARGFRNSKMACIRIAD